MAKINELEGILTTIADRVDKVLTEVKTLKDSLEDVDLPPNAQAALDRLALAVQAVDDVIPDAPPV